MSWVRTFLSSSDSQWYRLFKKSYGNPDKILSFEEDFSISEKYDKPFLA